MNTQQIEQTIKEAEQMLATLKGEVTQTHKRGAEKGNPKLYGRAGLPERLKGRLIGALEFGVPTSEIKQKLGVSSPTISAYRKRLPELTAA